jgi:hypothetical protein
MVKIPTAAISASTKVTAASTVIGLAGVAINEILKSRGITSKTQTFFLDPLGFIIEGIIELATAPKGITSEEYVRSILTPEKLDELYYLNLQKKLDKEEAAYVKAAKAAYLARKGEMASSKRQEATSNIKVEVPKLVQQEYIAPQAQSETKLPTQVDYSSRLLSQQARSREMADDAIATSQKIAAERLQIESQRKLLNQKRSVISSETSAIKNLVNTQQSQIDTFQKQKEEADQAVIQNEIQQRLKNLTATSQQPLVNTTKVLPPSVTVRGRGNKVLIKVMNDFGMTKAEAKRYIKKYGTD